MTPRRQPSEDVATQTAATAPTPRWWKVTGWFGIGWYVLFAIGAIVVQGEPPAYDQPLADIRGFFTAAGGLYLLGDYLADLAFILFFVPFIAGLQSVLGAAEGEPRIASRLVFAGGLTTVAIGGGATDYLDAVALGDAATSLDDGTLQGLLNANAVSIAAIGPAMALTAFAAAVVIWSTSVLWRWLAPLAVVSGLLHLVGALYVVPNDGSLLFLVRFAGLLTFAVFVLLTSVNLIKGSRKHVHQPPSP